jgi:hypothetical protein
MTSHSVLLTSLSHPPQMARRDPRLFGPFKRCSPSRPQRHRYFTLWPFLLTFCLLTDRIPMPTMSRPGAAAATAGFSALAPAPYCARTCCTCTCAQSRRTCASFYSPCARSHYTHCRMVLHLRALSCLRNLQSK